MKNTRDMSKLGYREIELLKDLLDAYLKAYKRGKAGFLGDGLTWEFNPNSGNVFLLDDDLNVGMLNEDNELEQFCSCSECGREGFISETEDEKPLFHVDSEGYFQGYCQKCWEKEVKV